MATDEGKQSKWDVTLNKQWNCSSCTKLALSVGWTHGLIAQLERLNGIQWLWVQIPFRPTFCSYFKESVSGVERESGERQRDRKYNRGRYIEGDIEHLYIYIYIYIYINITFRSILHNITFCHNKSECDYVIFKFLSH